VTDKAAARDQELATPTQRSCLFSVRIWKEHVAGGWEYRGSVHDVVTGANRNFRRWADLADFMIDRVEEDAGEGEQK
jgi:hypothetical protein